MMKQQGVLLGRIHTMARRMDSRKIRRFGIAAQAMAHTLLIAFLVAAGCYVVLTGGRTSGLSESNMEQPAGEGTLPARALPVLAEPVDERLGLIGGQYRYYAGPSAGLVKEPAEILVALDPGHGGADDGCVRGGVYEKALNLSISLEVQKRLQEMGYQVVLTRDSDQALTLGQRVRAAERAHADIYVSIHQNSSELSKVNGIELYYSAAHAGEDSRRLSELIHGSAIQNTGAKARSVFEWEELYVIREAAMPACLIEAGFLTNSAERSRLKTSDYQEKIAEGIADGIDRYFRP